MSTTQYCSSLASFLAKKGTLRVLYLFLALKLALFLFILFFQSSLPFSWNDYERNSDHFVGQPQSSLEQALSPYDGPQYLNIAYSGYKAMAEQDDKIYAFFPLYPALIKIFSPLFGFDFTLTGVALSLFFSLGGTLLFYRLTLLDQEEKIARKATWYFLIFPTAIFFLAVYTEALFFLLSIATFYFLRKKSWWLAGIFGFLGALSRPTGILLVIPFAIEYFIYLNNLNIKNVTDFFRKTRCGFLSLGLAPAGLISYFAYLYLLTGNFFYYFKALSWWGKSSPQIGRIFSLLHDRITNFQTLPWHSFHTSKVDFIAAVVFFALLIAMFKKTRFSYWAYAFFLLFLPLSSGETMSLTRYLSVSFPQFIYLGIQGSKNKTLDTFLVLIFILILSIFSLRFVNWHWVG